MPTISDVKMTRFKEQEYKRHNTEIKKLRREHAQTFGKEIKHNDKTLSRMQKEYEVNVANLENNLERKLVDLRSKQKERIHVENKRLEEEWFSTTRYGGEWDGKSENGNKEKWDELYDHNKMLEVKYLPHTLTCYMDVLNINDMDKFKEGIRTSLWDCDMCAYNIDIENIKIYDDEDVRFTIIEFTLDSLNKNKTDDEI